MLKRYFFLLPIAGGVLLGVAALVFSGSREREPVFRGRTLSQWVRKFPDSDARKAMQDIGTNALPCLLDWVRYETPPWKQRLYAAVNPALSSLNPQWSLYDEKQLRPINAAFVFGMLGPEAAPVIPELTQMLNAPSPVGLADRAVDVLAVLGDLGLPPLLEVLTNKNGQALAPHIAICFGRGISNGVPQYLHELLNSGDFKVRNAATNALRHLDPNALERARR